MSTADLYDHPDRRAGVALPVHFEHIFEGQGLEDRRSRVSNRRNRLWIAVHDHGLEAIVAQRKRRVAAAVTNSIPCPMRFGPRPRTMTFVLVGAASLLPRRRIQIGRAALESAAHVSTRW